MLDMETIGYFLYMEEQEKKMRGGSPIEDYALDLTRSEANPLPVAQRHEQKNEPKNTAI